MVLLSSIEFHLFSAETKLHYLQQYGEGSYTAPIHQLNYLVFLVQAAAYACAGFFLLRSAAHLTPNQRWHKLLLSGLILFSALGMLAVFSAQAGKQSLIRLNSHLFILWLTAYVCFIFLQSIRYPDKLYFVFKPKTLPGISADYPFTIQAIERHFGVDKPYRDSAYDIYQLALRLGHSKNHLQQAIRQQTNQSFREYVNVWRIEDAKRLLRQPENRQYTIQAIAEKVGFKSSATFYRTFKKQVGLSPTAYLKKG